MKSVDVELGLLTTFSNSSFNNVEYSGGEMIDGIGVSILISGVALMVDPGIGGVGGMCSGGGCCLL